MKGWTQNEAENRVRLFKMANPFSKSINYVVFDEPWGEWCIVTTYPGASTFIERKPRQGLKLAFVSRVYNPKENDPTSLAVEQINNYI